jgi:hypothetical protein
MDRGQIAGFADVFGNVEAFVLLPSPRGSQKLPGS